MMLNRNAAFAAACLATIINASPAHASRARVLSMGSGDARTILNGGSLYYDDFQNIFYNPAYLNDYRNSAIIEKSNFPNATAEGGFLSTFVTISFGMYLNRGNAVATNPYAASSGTAAVPPGNFPGSYTIIPVRPVELFLGGDMGVKWGVSAAYAANTAAAGNSNYLTASLGVVIPLIEPFATVRIGGSEPGKTHGFYRVGFRHRWGEWVPYAALVSANDNDGVNNLKETNWGLGIARNTKVGEGVSMNVSFSFWNSHDTGQQSAPTTEATRYYFPIDVSFEGDAQTWLTVRGGLSYRIMDRAKTGSGNSLTVGDTTTGRLGATFHIGKVDFDWAVGKALGTSETTSTPDEQLFDLASGFFAAASLSYRW